MALASRWFGTDLDPYRGCQGTYCFWWADTLPPLPPLDGSFSWLPTDVRDGLSYMDAGNVTIADPDGLPPSFVSFMSRPELRGAVPSCTACWWKVEEPVPSPLGDGGRLLTFLHDQQDVLLWHLLLDADGGHSVVAGSVPYGHMEITAEEAAQDLSVVAPDFESFLYRFWVENTAWFELNGSGDEDMSPPVLEYLSHYRPPTP